MGKRLSDGVLGEGSSRPFSCSKHLQSYTACFNLSVQHSSYDRKPILVLDVFITCNHIHFTCHVTLINQSVKDPEF
jgi:hypothetical protein